MLKRGNGHDTEAINLNMRLFPDFSSLYSGIFIFHIPSSSEHDLTFVSLFICHLCQNCKFISYSTDLITIVGWDLKIARMRRMELGLYYLRFDEIER